MMFHDDKFSRLRRSVVLCLSVGGVLVAAGWAAAFFMPFSPTASASKVGATPTIHMPVLPEPRDAEIGTLLPNPQSPLLVIHARQHDVPFILIEGGMPQTRRSLMRCGVAKMVREAGAQAGLNGTFFADARVQGTDNVLIGPSLCGNETTAVFNPEDKVALLTGRPLVLLSPKATRLVPYDPSAMATQDDLTAWLPGMTDAFLGGVWLVHNGLAADRKLIDTFHVHDAEDPRRRAFFCLLPDGRPALGATTYVTPSANLARALQAMGVQEAVLLDSGFSTSLVYGKTILVTGHTSPGIPSRPVPHAIVLFGKPAATLDRSVLMAKRV